MPDPTPGTGAVAAYLAEVREREQAATAQPWYAEPNTGAGRVWVTIGRKHFPEADMEPLFNFRSHGVEGRLDEPKAVAAYRQREADAAFVVGARTDLPCLLAAVEAVLGLHRKVNGGPPGYVDLCAECLTKGEVTGAAVSALWPCSTYRAIAGRLPGEGSG